MFILVSPEISLFPKKHAKITNTNIEINFIDQGDGFRKKLLFYKIVAVFIGNMYSRKKLIN